MLRQLDFLCLLQSEAQKHVRFATRVCNYAYFTTKCFSAATKIRNSGRTSIGSHAHKRESELRKSGVNLFPRITPSKNAVTCTAFQSQYAYLELDQSNEAQEVILQGMFAQDL